MHKAWRVTAVALLLIIVFTTIAFFPALSHDFVNWDDDHLLLANDAYRGLTLEHLHWMFTTTFGGHYQPLTWLSFGIDHHIWGVSAFGFHLTNLVWHVATACALFVLSRRLIHGDGHTRQPSSEPAAMFAALTAALLFAIHPLRVESVAWATERRDVLSGFWLVLTLIFYVHAAAPLPRRRHQWMLLSLICYCLSLLSKASGITLPFVLLVLDFYPLRRRADRAASPSLRFLLAEKGLFLLPACAVGWLALRAQAETGALWSLHDHPLFLRIGQAFYGVMFYLGKTLWPANLIPLYEQPPNAQPYDVPYIMSAIGTILITITVWSLRRRFPSLLAAWLCYLLLLAPVLGIAQSGPQLVADRYTYLACIPWAIVLGGSFCTFWCVASGHTVGIETPFDPLLVRGDLGGTGGQAASGTRGRHGHASVSHATRRIAILSGAAVTIMVLIILTRDQCRVWRNSYTLWSAVIDRAPHTGLAHANLATSLNADWEYDHARHHAQTALEILPNNRAAHFELAFASLQLNDIATAERHYRIAFDLADAVGKFDFFALNGLVQTLIRQERFVEAESLYRSALTTKPVPYGLHLRLGQIRIMLGDCAGAVAAWEAGLVYFPDDVLLLLDISWVLATSTDDMLRDGLRALDLVRRVGAAPGSSKVRRALAAAQAETGDFTSALATVDDLLSDNRLDLSDFQRAQIHSERAAYATNQALRDPNCWAE